jgi:hypothetical protein
MGDNGKVKKIVYIFHDDDIVRCDKVAKKQREKMHVQTKTDETLIKVKLQHETS